MDRFCGNCGSPLEEGSVCSCKHSTTQDQKQSILEQQQSIQQQQQYVQLMVPAPPNAFVIYLKRMWSLIIALVKSPAKVGTQFVSSADYKIALGLIGAQALAVAFLFLSFVGKYNSAIVAEYNLSTSNAYSTGTSTVSVSFGRLSDIEFPMFTVFVVVGIITFGLACLMAGVIMLIIKIFKGNTDYKHLLCVSGINSIMSTPFLLAAFFVSLSMPMDIAKSISSGNSYLIFSSFIFPLLYPLLIAIVGNIIGWFTSLKVIAGGSDIDDNKTIYVLFLSAIVMIIVTYLAIKSGGLMCLPSAIREGLSKLS